MINSTPSKDSLYVGIDPDCKKSGVAIWRPSDESYALNTLPFFELFVKLGSLKPSIRLVVIEAGWLNKHTGHGAYSKGVAVSARIGKNVGANHQVGKLIEEMCQHLKIPYELVRPCRGKGKYGGKNGKILGEEFKKITGIKGQTNQEERDAFMLVFRR